MNYFTCTFFLLFTSFIGMTQLSEDQKAALEQTQEKKSDSEQSNNTVEKEDRHILIMENAIAHMDESLQHIHLLFHESKDKKKAEEILAGYTAKYNFLVPDFSTSSLLEFEVKLFRKWLLENTNKSVVISDVLELFTVVESDLYQLINP